LSQRALRVLVTRPQKQAEPWVARLRRAGVEAVALPLIGIAPMADAAPLQGAWAGLAAYRLVVFVSPNAVQYAFAQRPAGQVWPPGTLAGAPGPGTARALREVGVPPAQVIAPPDDAPRHDSEALWAELAAHGPWADVSALIVRGLSEDAAQARPGPEGPVQSNEPGSDDEATGDVEARQRGSHAGEHHDKLHGNGHGHGTAAHEGLLAAGATSPDDERERSGSGREWLAETLRAEGVRVQFVVAYRRGAPTLDAAQRACWQAAWADPGGHLWLLSSSEALDHLRALGAPDLAASQALATHPRIAARARDAGFGRVLDGGASVASVVDCLGLLGRSIESSAP
jgi:uroporphyrinogen-III synthase